MAEISLSEARMKYGVPHKTLLATITRNEQNMREAFKARQMVGSRIWLIDDESEGFTSWLAQYTPGRGRKPITATTPEQAYNQRYYQERKMNIRQSEKVAEIDV